MDLVGILGGTGIGIVQEVPQVQPFMLMVKMLVQYLRYSIKHMHPIQLWVFKVSGGDLDPLFIYALPQNLHGLINILP